MNKTFTLDEISRAWDAATADLARQGVRYPASPSGWAAFVGKLLDAERPAVAS